MVRGVPSGQLFATCRSAPALVPAANAAAAGAAHDPAAYSTGPRAAEECTICCEWIQEVHIESCLNIVKQRVRYGYVWKRYIINDLDGWMTCNCNCGSHGYI